ncbi:MAG TPA: hypothetical protein H9966_04025 [Candidatus Prevotella avicola]|uniref:Uncharacterized protein n=1 Tax=Candidatus Prevotella avicola TaxID=2838738 RepID=A0A9D2FYL0_9BACT|nr:hypothetical protein [Candidatus Prevotella avicola]
MLTFFLPLLALAFIACGKRVHIDEISFRGDIVIYEGAPYTGDIWTEDESTGRFRTETGILRSLTFYHRNGKEAITMQVSEQGAPHTEIFDEQGQPMDMMTFQTKYADIWIKMAMIQGELMMK